jgi:hypothetical protein
MEAMRWRAYLEGGELDLALLEDQFDRGDAVVGRDDNGYWVESPRFEGLTALADVQCIARDVLNAMNGVAALVYQSYRPANLRDHFRDSAGNTFVLMTAAIVATGHLAAEVHAHGPNGELIPPPPPPRPPTMGPDYLRVALLHPNVREVLDLLAPGPADWVTLYKVYEVIKVEGGHKRWAPMSEYNAFTASANLPSVSGRDARHARSASGRPKRTMTLDQARAFIRGVLDAWIWSK